MTDVPRDPSIQPPPPDRRDEYAKEYPEFHRRVVVYLRTQVSRSDAQLIADEVMERTWKKWESVRTLDRPLQWVLKVAHNLMIDAKKVRPVVFRELSDADAALVAPNADPEKRVELLETFKNMLKLPERAREALFLASWYDLPVAEIAKVMSLKPHTVSQYLRDARRELKRMSNREGYRLESGVPPHPLPGPHARNASSGREDEKG